MELPLLAGEGAGQQPARFISQHRVQADADLPGQVVVEHPIGQRSVPAVLLRLLPPDFVIDAHHRLAQIEKSFRMSKHDLQARSIRHHQRESIEAHLVIVFAALAVSRWIEDRTG